MAIRKPQPASPLRWLADVFLPLVGAGKLIQNDAREFLVRSIETNSTRVQNDILNRVQESRGSLEVEIRKLLHEVNRIAGEALVRARKVKGEPAVEAELQRLEAFGNGNFWFGAVGSQFEVYDQRMKGAAARPVPPSGQNDCENRVSRNSPSFAVALNWGIGSNSLNADVNAFERLQIVLDRNSSYFGSKYRSCTVRARCLGASSLPCTNAS